MMDPMTAVTVGLGLAATAAAALGTVFLLGASKSLEASEHIQQLSAQLGALGAQSGETGDQLLDTFDDLSGKLPETRDQLADLAKPLLAAGLSGDKLSQSLQATAASAALTGDKTASTFTTLEEKIQAAVDTGQKLKIPVKGLAALAQAGADVNDIAKRMGLSTKQLGDELKAGTVDAAKFGDALNASLIEKGKPAIEQASLSLSSLSAKFEENTAKMFEDVNTTPFTTALKDVASLFDQDTASGLAMKTTVTAIYDKFFLLASKALPYVKHGFQDVEIAALKIYIAAKPLESSLTRLYKDFGGAEGQANNLSIAWGFLVSNLTGSVKIVVTVADEIDSVVESIKELYAWASKAGGAVSNLGGSLSSVGGGSGGSGGGIMSTISSLIPHADGGVVTGVSGGMAQVSAAPGEGLASVGPGETILPASQSGGGGGGNVTINATVNVSGAGSSGEALEITEEQLSLVLERLALSQGLGQAA